MACYGAFLMSLFVAALTSFFFLEHSRKKAVVKVAM
jgi:hypothetical protein